HRTIENRALQQIREVRHVRVPHDEISQSSEAEAGQPVWIAVGLRQLLRRFFSHDGIYREFFLVSMELQLEAFRDQLLQHDLPLTIIRLALSLRLSLQIIFLRIHPARSADNLFRMNAVCKGDEITQRRVEGGELTALNAITDAL